MTTRTRLPLQLEMLPIVKFEQPPGRGGKCKGAGRKRVATRPGVAHCTRSTHNGRHPVHVTLRLLAGSSRFVRSR